MRIFALIGLLVLLAGCTGGPVEYDVEPEPTVSVLPEVEATEYMGVQLTPLDAQRNNAIVGTQYIDKESYGLEVSGLVENKLNLSYDELLALPAYSEVVYMPCVEGWGFTAKWTGFRVTDLLDIAGVNEEGVYVMFYSSDGYSTGMPLEYLENESIIMAYGINDVTLPAERGFPFQLVAKSKYGYKWAKWIVKIEVMDEEMRGFWEERGYSNDATAGGPAFE
jgi:DMSO/TMAO reductase YedYZ molybdopterin-dependent catalytic subunit